MKTVAVAFSGGADSAFLLAVAARSGLKRLMAVTVDSVFVTRKEIEQARQTAADLGVMHQVLEVDILGCKQVTANSPDRCYHCKTLVFSLIRKAAEQAGMFHVLHGVNINDLSDYRPGLKAAEKLGVLSPLVEAGFSKHQIRICSREMGLPTWDLPSQSCLAARIPFGRRLPKRPLPHRAGGAVYPVSGLCPGPGAKHGMLARIETDAADIEALVDYRNRISEALKSYGFTYVSLDLDGYHTGK